MELIKMAALGAGLSYGALCAYNQPVQRLEAALAVNDDRDHRRSGDEDWSPISTGSIQRPKTVSSPAVGPSK
jgi:hypothetical protein